jgi:hypothetical protein
MALLQRRSIPGVSVTCADISAWAGCSKSTVWRIEKSDLKKAKRLCAEHGISFPIEFRE